MNLEVQGEEATAVMADFLYILNEKEYHYKFDAEEPFSVIVNVMSRIDAEFEQKTDEPAVETFAKVRLLQNPAGGKNAFVLDFKIHEGNFFAFRNFYQKVYKLH